jgi:transcriptional regulator with XRE-family HTH domain
MKPMKREQAFVATLRREIQAGTCTKLGLAKKAGISRSHLDKILAGDCRLSLELADTLADAINKPLEEMIANDHRQQPIPA